MKTPDEIKNGLECCTPRWVANHWKSCSSKCPYITLSASCRGQLVYDALVYIQQFENHIGELTEKVKQIRAEQQNLICDFMDYINDGVQNPAPYCAFGKSCVLVDKRGWCRPGEHECNGFVPRVRDDNENA